MRKIASFIVGLSGVLFSSLPAMAQTVPLSNNSIPYLSSTPGIASYGMGGGVSCPSPSLSLNVFGADQNSEFDEAESFGGMIGISVPLGFKKAAMCRQAAQSQLALMDAQRAYYQSMTSSSPAMLPVVPR